MRLLCSLLCPLLLALPAAAQSGAPSPSTALDATLSALVPPRGSGVAILVAQGDRPVYRSARGLAQVALGVPLTADQRFHIASITKSFTAALIVQMAERGEVALDAPLGRYLPDLAIDPAVTLRRLLSHTAGIADKDATPQPPFGPDEVPLAQQVARIAARPLRYRPGTEQHYSNSGYILLAAVIEKVTGMPWHEAMRARLFVPLGLADTGYDPPNAVVPRLASGYTLAEGQLRDAAAFNISIPKTAGSLRSTPDDLLRWMRALVTGRIVRGTGFAEMRRPALDGVPLQERYGLGLYIWQVRGETAIGHTGQIDGYASALLYLPSRDVTVVVLANNDEFDAQTLARRAAAIMLGKPYPLPLAHPLSADALARLAGRYGDDPTTARTIAIVAGRLTVARAGRPALPAIFDGEGDIRFVADDLSYFTPVRDAAGAVIRLDYYARGEAPAVPLIRVAAP